jgi:hypothetical protein
MYLSGTNTLGFATNGTLDMVLDANGALGLGTTSLTNVNLRVSKNITGSTGSNGVFQEGIVQSDVTVLGVGYTNRMQTQATAFTLANYYHYYAVQGTIGASSAITNQMGFVVESNLTSATNNYGFWGNIAAGSNRWNLYMNGTANNYLAGSLGIGQTSLTGRNLAVSKNITGATTSYGIVNDGTIQSDVTTTLAYYITSANTTPASFTLTSLHHYLASQSTIGAGSTVTNQFGYNVSANLIGATNNYGFYGNIPAATGRWNLYMNGTAANYLAGDTGIGNSQGFVSAGPILTTTLSNGGSGYVDGTYTDVAATNISSNGVYALFTIVVSGGIVTTATLTWGGTTYRAGDTVTVSNTLLGGTGSGLIITINTVDSSQLTIANANGGDISLFRNDTGLSLGENLGTIKFLSNDSTAKASGILAEISGFGAGTTGGGYLSFFTSTPANPLVEAMRIDSRGGVGIGATTLTGFNLRISKNITGAVSSFGIQVNGTIQSDVTTSAYYNQARPTTAASAFTLTSAYSYAASVVTIGLGSTITNLYGFAVEAAHIGATNNYGFFSNLASATNTWNLYMQGTANNYLAGNLGIGSTSLTARTLSISKNITGATTSYAILNDGTIQSDVTSVAYYNRSIASTVGALVNLYHNFASQGTFGSTVTTQAGYWAASSMIGATNNYGFYGDIPSGTNRWNLYMAGTADNYLAGKLNIGTTSIDTTTRLHLFDSTNGYVGLRLEGSGQYAGSDWTLYASSNPINSSNDFFGIYNNSNTDSATIGYKLIVTKQGTAALGTITPNASARLQVDSTTQGFLPPRMTAAQRAAIASPATGLMVYQTDGTEGVYVYSGGAWKSLTMV